MGSELWQRLRAARQAANLRQIDLARKLNITRTGYAFMEWKTPENRVTPNVRQIQIIADAVNVPVESLMSDAVEPTDLLLRRATPRAGSSVDGPSSGGGARMVENFWRAVEFATLTERPELSAAFSPHPGPQTVDWLHGKVAVLFAAAPVDVRALVCKLALHDLSTRRRHDKHILVWQPGDPDQALLRQAEEAERDYGVSVHVVDSGNAATAKLLSLV